MSQLLVSIGPDVRLIYVLNFHQMDAGAALNAFLPRAGADYARQRNYDHGPGRPMTVSGLSPWVRMRRIPEWQLVAAVLQHHSASQAGKFIDEVCWRTYWKGWLRLRPGAWDAYLRELARERAQLSGSRGYKAVVNAESGIECLDAWTRELLSSGYLHNHARMWYASIWVHTLKLPWTLGADFFLRHLLDGDPACNTLSWRWVAGLHTAGKTYLARADNIRQFSAGRFAAPIALATAPADVSGSDGNPPAGALPPLPPLPAYKRLGLLVQDDDLSALNWLAEPAAVSARAGLIPQSAYRAQQIAASVFDFRQQQLRQTLAQHGPLHTEIAQVVQWAVEADLDLLLMAEPPVGLWNSVLVELEAALRREGIRLALRRHWWDAHFYPHAKAGFFRFKKAIPAALQQLSR